MSRRFVLLQDTLFQTIKKMEQIRDAKRTIVLYFQTSSRGSLSLSLDCILLSLFPTRKNYLKRIQLVDDLSWKSWCFVDKKKFEQNIRIKSVLFREIYIFVVNNFLNNKINKNKVNFVFLIYVLLQRFTSQNHLRSPKINFETKENNLFSTLCKFNIHFFLSQQKYLKNILCLILYINLETTLLKQ